MATKAEEITAKVAKWISGEDKPKSIASFNEYTMLEYITQKKDVKYMAKYQQIVSENTKTFQDGNGKILNQVYNWDAIREEFAQNYFYKMSAKAKKEEKEQKEKERKEKKERERIEKLQQSKNRINEALAKLEKQQNEQQDTPIEENK